MTASTVVPPQFAQRLLALVNAKGWDAGQFPGQITERLLPAWIRAEGNSTKWNPLSTTLFLPGATPYNSFVVAGATYHVWNYTRPVDGIAATGMTLANGFYSGILGDIQNALGSGKTAEQIVQTRRAEFATWGTNPDAILGVLKGLV